MSVMALRENELKLVADGQTEQRVLDYLKENASAVLVEKINAGKKTLAGALEYAKGKARAMAKGAGSICIDDETVFGWIIHFFEEDSIKEGAKKKSTPTVPASVFKKPKPAKKAKPDKPSGPIVFDLFTGEAVSAVGR